MPVRMFENIKHTLRKIEGFIEVVLLTLLYNCMWQHIYSSDTFLSDFDLEAYILPGIYFLLIFALFFHSESFRYGYLKLTNVVVSQWISLLIVNVVTFFQLSLMANQLINVGPMLILTFADYLLALACSYLFTAIYHRLCVPRKMLMIYGSDYGLTLKVKMEKRSDKYKIKSLIPADKGYEYIIRQIPNYDAVIISDLPAELRNEVVKYCFQIEKQTYLTTKISDVIVRGAEDVHLVDTPLMRLRVGGLTFEERFFKRLMDIVLCLIALAVLWPLMFIIALAIKLEDGGPVFFKQRRCTRNNEEFFILKFRSMVVDAEKDGKSIPATDHDPRITKVGRVIRGLRVDELPQIFNILSGKMSIVGPRPERIEHVQKYTKEMPEFAFRAKVKGGLTGYAQVYGKYNTTPYDKLKLDLTYIENYSFMLDCKLILMTVATMFKRESTEGFSRQTEVKAGAKTASKESCL